MKVLCINDSLWNHLTDVPIVGGIYTVIDEVHKGQMLERYFLPVPYDAFALSEFPITEAEGHRWYIKSAFKPLMQVADMSFTEAELIEQVQELFEIEAITTDKEYKKLMKALYQKDRSKKFRR